MSTISSTNVDVEKATAVISDEKIHEPTKRLATLVCAIVVMTACILGLGFGLGFGVASASIASGPHVLTLRLRPSHASRSEITMGSDHAVVIFDHARNLRHVMIHQRVQVGNMTVDESVIHEVKTPTGVYTYMTDKLPSVGDINAPRRMGCRMLSEEPSDFVDLNNQIDIEFQVGRNISLANDYTATILDATVEGAHSAASHAFITCDPHAESAVVPADLDSYSGALTLAHDGDGKPSERRLQWTGYYGTPYKETHNYKKIVCSPKKLSASQCEKKDWPATSWYHSSSMWRAYCKAWATSNSIWWGTTEWQRKAMCARAGGKVHLALSEYEQVGPECSEEWEEGSYSHQLKWAAKIFDGSSLGYVNTKGYEVTDYQIVVPYELTLQFTSEGAYTYDVKFKKNVPLLEAEFFVFDVPGTLSAIAGVDASLKLEATDKSEATVTLKGELKLGPDVANRDVFTYAFEYSGAQREMLAKLSGSLKFGVVLAVDDIVSAYAEAKIEFKEKPFTGISLSDGPIAHFSMEAGIDIGGAALEKTVGQYLTSGDGLNTCPANSAEDNLKALYKDAFGTAADDAYQFLKEATLQKTWAWNPLGDFTIVQK